MRLLIFIFLTPFMLNAQSRKTKSSYAKGTFFGSIGYDLNAYGKSKVNFSGPGYEFDLEGVKGKAENGIDFSNLGLLQYKGQFGYMIANNWGLSLNYNRMNYRIPSGNQVLLTGTINPGVDPVTNLNGTYLNQPLTIDTATFSYSNKAVRFYHLDVCRIDTWIGGRSSDKFALSSVFSFGAGAVSSKNDFTFGGKSDVATSSISGFGLTAGLGFRFEFFDYFFIQPTFGGGYIQQLDVNTRINEPNALAKQKYTFANANLSIGFLLYLRPTNSCDSCPHW
jgi:hypothetical protein